MAEASKSKTTLVLNRNFTLNTTKGHSVVFVKNEPTHVPPAIYQEALAIGAQPVEGEDVHIEERVALDDAPADPADRAPLILDAIKKLVADNTRDNFTAGGSPTVSAVSEVVGFKVQAKEIAPVWQSYHDEMAAGDKA